MAPRSEVRDVEETRLSVRMPRDLVEALDDLGREQHRRRGDLIRESVARYVDQRTRQRLRAQLIEGYREWQELYPNLSGEEWDRGAWAKVSARRDDP